MINRQPAARTRQCGMTLIEILVAILVLSIGLLGLAGLQLKGMQVNQGSIYRWQAAMLAEDIADRMRADRVSALARNYALTLGATAPTSGVAPGTGTWKAITDWLGRVATLPGGKAGISAPSGPLGNQVQITVRWTDTRAQAGSGQTATTGLGGISQVVLNTEL